MHNTIRPFSRRGTRPLDIPGGTIKLEKQGFTLTPQDGRPVKVPWDEILEACAFKMDLITQDLFCLTLSTGKNGVAARSIHINEEMTGWYTLIEKLGESLPGAELDWWAKVAYPPFATNERVIYRRAATLKKAVGM